MPEREQSIGELELEVLKVIWEEQPCSVFAVAERMAERGGYARTTVLTVMQRLTAKGFIRRRKCQGVYRYSTKADKRSVLDSLIRQFIDSVFDGSSSAFVAYLAESEGLSDAQVKSLQAIAASLDNGATGGS